MTHTAAPSINDLAVLINNLEDDVFSNFARAIVNRLQGKISIVEYMEAMKKAAECFTYADDQQSLLHSFLFLDPRISNIPDLQPSLSNS